MMPPARFRLSITDRSKVCICGNCSGIIPGWPHNYPKGLIIGAWALIDKKAEIDALKASCPLGKIQLVTVDGDKP